MSPGDQGSVVTDKIELLELLFNSKFGDGKTDYLADKST